MFPPFITSIKRWWPCDTIAIPIHMPKSFVVLSRARITPVRTLILIIIVHYPSTNDDLYFNVDGSKFSRCAVPLLVTVRPCFINLGVFHFP